eukprot:31086-Pelagococcus_subviridis.AAC.9
MRRAKSLRNGVHHANAFVWEPVYRTHLERIPHRVPRHRRLVRVAPLAAVRARLDVLLRVIPRPARGVQEERHQNPAHRREHQHPGHRLGAEELLRAIPYKNSSPVS